MSLLYPACILDVPSRIQTTNDVYVRPVTVLSAAVRIVSEQPRTYIYAQNCQLQQPSKNMPATKEVFKK